MREIGGGGCGIFDNLCWICLLLLTAYLCWLKWLCDAVAVASSLSCWRAAWWRLLNIRTSPWPLCLVSPHFFFSTLCVCVCVCVCVWCGCDSVCGCDGVCACVWCVLCILLFYISMCLQKMCVMWVWGVWYECLMCVLCVPLKKRVCVCKICVVCEVFVFGVNVWCMCVLCIFFLCLQNAYVVCNVGWGRGIVSGMFLW